MVEIAPKVPMLKRAAFALGALAVFAVVPFHADALSRSALGLVVEACRANAALSSSPLPCLKVEPAGEGAYAVLREPQERERTVLTALAPFPGIEDRRLFAADAPNFFAQAWAERGWVLKPGTGGAVPPGFALAVNRQGARSQDRLHVHIACLRPDVQEQLSRTLPRIGSAAFAPLKPRFGQKTIWAMRLDVPNVAAINPLHLLHDRMPGADTAVGEHMLIAVQEKMPDGRDTVVLLTNSPPQKSRWKYSVESFLQSSCA